MHRCQLVFGSGEERMESGFDTRLVRAAQHAKDVRKL
jgi:hypothetical protein